MFIPKSFQQTDLNLLKDFVSQYPQATVIAHHVTEEDGAAMEASHIPMVWISEGDNSYLLGHIAKVNPLSEAKFLTLPWLIIFQNSGHYISPNWYPSKANTHKEVPTWNYQSVHITGKATLLADSHSLINIISLLTTKFEAMQPMPWSLKDAPEKYIQGLCRAIVGIRIDISDVRAQFKLSQNKSMENKAGVILGLREIGSPEANDMANLINAQ